MIKIVSWNIAKRSRPWYELAEMARQGAVDVALLQEAGSPPKDLVGLIQYEDDVFWNRNLYDRWPMVVSLSDHVEVDSFRQVPPISELGEREIGVSGIGTIAAAKIAPRGRPQDAFVAISMYARWMKPHPWTESKWQVGASDVSVHRILSDLSTFIGDCDPSKHRVLAAGDLNMIYGATGNQYSLPERERSVWVRFKSLGFEFLGPQVPEGRTVVSPQPDTPDDTRNTPTFHTRKQSPQQANRQLDYVFASRGFHRQISVRALNSADDWGSSDHCRLMIEISTGGRPSP